jgi:DNA-binding NarL/FixJ family response regulator
MVGVVRDVTEQVQAYQSLEHCPETRVIVLTTFPEEELVQRALQSGALSYLMKNLSRLSGGSP